MKAPEEFVEKVFNHCVQNNYCGYPAGLDDITVEILKNGWLYCRPYGLFKVSLAGHVFLQSFLYGLFIYDELERQWNKSDKTSHRNFERFFIEECHERHEQWQETFLEMPGTAFLSNVSYRGYAVVSRMRNLTRTEHAALGFECDIITLEEYDNLPYEREEFIEDKDIPTPLKKVVRKKKAKKDKEVYEFKKGEILDFDDIMYIQAIGGNDWWDPQEEGSDMIIITQDIKIEICVTKSSK